MDEHTRLSDPLAALPAPARQVVPRGRRRTEPELRAAVAAWLRKQGVPLASRMVCLAGEPDIVAADHSLIVEVKYQLSRKALYQALGQAQLYGQAINPDARLVVVGYCTPETLSLVSLIAQIGVEVLCWDDRDVEAEVRGRDAGSEVASAVADATYRGSGNTIAGMSQATAPDHPLRILAWHVADLARSHGILNASRLATTARTNRQSLYAIWNNTSDQVSLALLTRLARALDANPGDWFVWEATTDASHHPVLRWNIAAEATTRGLDLSQLGFRAEVHPTSMRPIWSGEQQAVTLTILGRLALALDRPAHRFSIGDMFVWQDKIGDDADDV